MAGWIIAERVHSADVLPGVRVLSMQTEIADVVTIHGSLLGGDLFSPQSNSIVAEMTASMLDEGSIHRDKFAVSDILEGVGASLSFWTGTYRVRFAGRCLSKDVPLVIELLGEQLRFPAMKAADLEFAKKRRIGELKKSKEDTGTRAMAAFLKELYPENHPNFFIPLDRRIDDAKRVKAVDLEKFHHECYGPGNLTIVAVGDVDRRILEDAAGKAFVDWKMSPLSIQTNSPVRAKDRKASQTQVVTMKEKSSVDVIMGQPIGIDREHEDFYPLMVGNFVLGGNFSSRLMATVRDEEGLTYGTGSAIAGVDNGNDGFWYVSGTYSPHLVERGLESTMEQIEGWISGGVTKAELEVKKTTITGSYRVTLATTNGLASRILVIVERGKELTYIDEYPDRINAVTHEKANEAIKKYCHPGKLVTVIAGSVAEDLKPWT